MSGNIRSINISEKKGGKKFPVSEAIINSEGIAGDGHSGKWHRQISLLSYESIVYFNSELEKKSKNPDGSPMVQTEPGDFGENITTEGIDLNNLKIGGRLYINTGQESNPAVVLEVTQIGKECPRPCSIYYRIGSCIMPQQGIFCKVIKTGIIKTGYAIKV